MFLEPLERLLMGNPTLVAISETNILQGQGRRAEAIKKARAALNLARTAYGADHGVTGSCWNNLGILLNKDGQDAAALEAFEKALEVRRRALPDDHPHGGAALTNLKRTDEAVRQLREALAFRKRVLGDHPDTAYTWLQLGSALAQRSDHRDAVACFRDALRAYRLVLGDLHPDTQRAAQKLGDHLLFRGEYDEGRAVLDASLKAHRELYGPVTRRPPEPSRVQPLEGAGRAGAQRRPAHRPRGRGDGPLGHRTGGDGGVQDGVGEVQGGEGVMCLRRAFQQAGARTVVTSLWAVPDEHTAKMMPRFLELWLGGTGKADALRKAQLEMIATLRERGRSDPRYRDAPPYFWGGFVCHGLPE